MRNTLFCLFAIFAVSAPVCAQKLPRTADGHPDLQGIWTNVTLTPLERPAEFKGKKTLNDTEARAFEHKDTEVNNFDRRDNGPIVAGGGVFASDVDRAYNNLFIDRGSELARVDGAKRTSLIVDPEDGKVPPLTEAAKARNAARARVGGRFDSVEDRPLGERCIVGFGSTSGPPMLPVLYNNNYQIVQTPENVMILVEMVHDVRVIRINGSHPPDTVRLWLGDSVGHWEGDTLVVDTTNFTGKTRFRGSTDKLHVTERFTRTAAGSVLYKATIEDPSTFTRPWTVEFPFIATAGPVYEYACHEGNYAITDILGGARKADGVTTDGVTK